MKTLLLVEDNPSDEKLTKIALRDCGVAVDVIVAHDGAEALAILHGEPGLSPSLVLLDLKLPLIDGLEVLERIRADERTKRLPVVVLTSSKEEEDVVRCYQLGANAYVRKPVDFDELVTTGKTIGVFWLTMNLQPPGAG